jgi:hypothetical protein
MWRSVFLHEFRNARMDDFKALAGQIATAPPVADRLERGIRIRPATSFSYVLSEPLPDVIGISLRLTLALDPPALSTSNGLNLISLGAFFGAQLRLGLLRFFLRAPGERFLGPLTLPMNRDFELRFDWHASGQARLFIDEKLVAYDNSVSPGSVVPVDRITIGSASGQPAPAPSMTVSRVFVRLLQRQDSLAHLSKLLPKADLNGAAKDCQPKIVAGALGAVDKLRAFMALFHQAKSQPWSAAQGPATGPFSADAIKAHTLSNAAATALLHMIRANDFSHQQSFLDPFREFLAIMYRYDPQRYAALVVEISQEQIVPENCAELMKEKAEEYFNTIRPLLALLEEASKLVRSVAEE